VGYVLLLAIVAFGVPLALNLGGRVNAEVRTQAQGQADLVAATAADLLAPARRPALRALADTASSSLRGRVLIVGPGGSVLADSAGPGQLGASYGSRPEIYSALHGRQVQVQRSSRTLGQQILATAVPIIRNGRPVGAARVTQSVSAIHSAVRRAEFMLAVIALIVLALGLAAGRVIADHIVRPIQRLEAVARRVAQGDLSARAVVEGSREQRSLALSFNDMTARIERLLAAQQQFVADASHQLRTPLTGLRLRLEEARTTASSETSIAGLDPADATAAELDAATDEVDRLSHIVDELLLLSRAGERRAAAAAVDLVDVASAALARWRADAATAGVRLEAAQEGRGPSVWAARSDIDRALDALIENAVRYSAPGGVVVLASGLGFLEVRDHGAGLDPDELELVFERFHRGRAGRGGPPGTGLGLAIARELAAEWGAEVTLRNRPGGGAVARLSWPVEDPVPGSDLPVLNPVRSRLAE
jgi:signal transduction histidine kinase